MLVGGGDLDPARYGGTTDPHIYGVDPERDQLETDLLRAADRHSLPALCICRGMQVMNVAFGGSLHPHLPDLAGSIEHGAPVADTRVLHDVRAAPSSRLHAICGDAPLSCSSHHHQGVDRIGDGLTATGWSPDGLIEAVERMPEDPARDNWMVGVQWHPEDTAEADPRQQALFDAFIHATSRRPS
jgi:putative glutamine amidotransferase